MPEESSWTGILPYIIIPIILAILIILLLRRKKSVNVTVLETKAHARVGDAPQKWVYVCGIGERVIGKNRPTTIQVLKGSVIRVAVSDIKMDEEGNLTWWNPEVLGEGKAEDPEAKLRKMAGQKKSKE